MDARRRLVEAVRDRGPFADEASAEVAIDATLLSLAELLLPHERRRLAEALPRALHAGLPTSPGVAGLDERTLYEAAADHLSAPSGQVVEAVQVVCAELASLFPPVREAFVHHPLSPMFAPVERDPSAPSPRAAHVRGATLASGRSGSLAPLAVARPERAQAHSVVPDDSAHGATKVSSATGMTQEREGESLAEARPGKG